jgi:hypothetical protein
LHRRCLHRHVGRLRPPFDNWEGSISSGAAHPGRSPCSPRGTSASPTR